MPKAEDITGDIGKLRSRKVLPDGEIPVLPHPRNAERRLAFNPSSFFFWTIILCFVVLQFAFLWWLA